MLKQDKLTISEQIRMSKRTIEMYQNKIDNYHTQIEKEQGKLNTLYIEAGYKQIRCYYKDCKTSFFINPNDDTSFYKCPKCKELLDPNEYVIPF